MGGIEAGLTTSMEDYLEAIHVLSGEKRVVRVKDIAERVGVTMPSVNGAMKALAGRGLVQHERYEDVELTRKGAQVARAVLARHRQLRGFLIDVLGIEQQAAEREACKLEHTVAPETLARLAQHAARVRTCGDGRPHCLPTGEGGGATDAA